MKRDTELAHLARETEGFVNPPVVRGSTVIFNTMAELDSALDDHARDSPYSYGRMGTPTERALENALAQLDSAYGAVVLESGLAAVSTAIMSSVSAGEHILVTDTCYGPTRELCDGLLARFGVETEYYDPLLCQEGKPGIEGLLRKNTRIVYMESPGSRTFEMQDVPAIAATCRAHGITTITDNTWATPLGFRPIEHGVDLVVQSLTKYIAGHSDVMLGVISACDESSWQRVKDTALEMGHACSPDDAWLGLRGLRSLSARLDRHEASAREIVEWLQMQPEVDQVLYPALRQDPGHRIFTRDFDRATGLFGVVLHTHDREAVRRMVEGLDLFQMGYSWGGFESLLIPLHPDRAVRSASESPYSGAILRLSIGLEDAQDLIEDLREGFKRLSKTS